MNLLPPLEFPLSAARWFFLGVLVLTAWMYGGTREWARDAVTWLLIANSGLFVLGMMARKRLPRLPLPAGVAVALLLIQGWFMLWNSQRRYIDGARIFIDRFAPLPGMPGFMDAGLVFPSLLLASGLLGAFCIACDLARNPIWRHRVWVTLCATGLSLVILGMAQRLTDAQSIFWDVDRNLGQTFFAVFRYHANAGAFINLILPLIAALAVQAWLAQGSETKRVFWTLATLVTASAGFVNVSRAANVLCAFLLIGMAIALGCLKFQMAGKRGALAGASLAVGLTFAAMALAFSFGIEKTVQRWDIGLWKNTPQEDGRYQAYEVILKSALPAAGPWGFGPGTFEPMFDVHRRKSGSQVAGRWDMAHSDALQTPMEWGWVGAAAWLVLIGGAFVRAVRGATSRDFGNNRIFAAGCAFSLAGVALHSLVDFPLQIAGLQLYTIAIVGLSWGLPSENLGNLSKNKLAVRQRKNKVVDAQPRTISDPK